MAIKSNSLSILEYSLRMTIRFSSVDEDNLWHHCIITTFSVFYVIYYCHSFMLHFTLKAKYIFVYKMQNDFNTLRPGRKADIFQTAILNTCGEWWFFYSNFIEIQFSLHQYWFRQWLVACEFQAVKSTNAEQDVWRRLASLSLNKLSWPVKHSCHKCWYIEIYKQHVILAIFVRFAIVWNIYSLRRCVSLQCLYDFL